MARAMTAAERNLLDGEQAKATAIPERKFGKLMQVVLGRTVLEVTGLDDHVLQKEMGLTVTAHGDKLVFIAGTRTDLAILQDDLKERSIPGEFGFCMEPRLQAAAKRLAKSLGQQLDATVAR